MYEQLLKRVREKLILMENLSDDNVRELIYKEVCENKEKLQLDLKNSVDVIEAIFNSLRRLGILQPLLEDESINEIMVNGYETIFIERRGVVQRLDEKFQSEEELLNIIQMIVSRVGRRVNTAEPIVDARLSDGSRINVVLPPISLSGPTLSIRKFNKKVFTMEEYIRLGSISPEAARDLRLFVQAGYNIFISGGTSSGKTTFLNSLSMEIPKGQRVITIEDSAELKLEQENWVRLETRNSNSENMGQISMRDLIKTALRMRPDRIIVGEVRGAEAFDMVQAMNTGHDGCLSTAHANSARDMLTRLETMMYSAAQIPILSIRKQISAAIDIMVHLDRNRDGKRKVFQIYSVSGIKDDEIQALPLYEYSEEENKLVKTEHRVQREFKLKNAGLYNAYLEEENFKREIGA